MARSLSRILIATVIFLLVVSIVAAALGFFTVRRSFPRLSGEVRLQGLNGEVDIYRDRFGIPQIYATTMHDLFFAQGYVHAQDRFWQMDFWRHIGSGRLSEMFGESQLETDTFLRRLGWRRVVQQEIESLDPTSRAFLESYSEGVNAYLADHQGSALSLEYAVLKLLNAGYQPEPWEPLHTLTWGKAMAWDLGGNMEVEMARARLLKLFNSQQIAELFPPYPEDHPYIVPADELAWHQPAVSNSGSQHLSWAELEPGFGALQSRIDGLNSLLGPGGPGIGSNSWAISGDRTNTGKPLLANDPHLGIQMPSIWYEVGLHCSPKGEDCPLDVTGFSFAGTPGVVIGHNDRIAWGFTNMGPDVMDLYVEKINPDNPDQYEFNDEWVDMDLIHETIQVAGAEPVEITVRHTRHGPIIWEDPETNQEIQQEVGIELPEDFAIALRWTALEPSRTIPALMRINLAQNWEQFRQAASEFDVPPQNIVYADIDGNIGYQSPGRIPVRRNGDGLVPAPGWKDEFEWTGYMPFEDLPSSFNPPKGYIVTANNAVIDSSYPYMISKGWDYGFRAARIVELVESATGPIDIAYIQKMQGDDKDLSAEVLVPVLLSVSLKDPRLEANRQILEGWDYKNHMDSAPAALYNVFWKNLLAQTFHDDLPEETRPEGGSRYFEVMRRMIQDPRSLWWDNRLTDQVETMEDIIRLAFTAAVDETEALLGQNPDRWRWGDLHFSMFRNATLGESGISPIEAIFNRGAFPTSGGDSIVNATGWNVLEPYAVDSLPSMRMIVDLGDLGNSIAIHTTGQSGHAYHSNYIDMADLWRLLQYHPMLWDRLEVEANAGNHLRLLP